MVAEGSHGRRRGFIACVMAPTCINDHKRRPTDRHTRRLGVHDDVLLPRVYEFLFAHGDKGAARSYPNYSATEVGCELH